MPLKLERVMFYSDNVTLKVIPMEVTLVGITMEESDEHSLKVPSANISNNIFILAYHR